MRQYRDFPEKTPPHLVSQMTQTAGPLVSVIIATYNRASIISHAIDSVLHQTFRDFEIIVVDDGSSDGTGQLLHEKYRGKIIYVSSGINEGLSAARNRGVIAARGKFVAILDDDDIWLPEKLEMQIELMGENPSLGLVYCESLKVDENDELIGEIKGTERGALYDHLLIGNCLGPPSGILLLKDAVSKSGYFDERLRALEDWDLWIRVSQLYDIDFVNQPLVKYRVHSDNMSKNIGIMQQSTFIVLDKYWSAVCNDTIYQQKKNEVYSNHYINFAWKQYHAGDKKAFQHLIMKALEHNPLHHVVLQGDELHAKEKVFFEALNAFWDERKGCIIDRAQKGRNDTIHYIQLAWEYYHRGDMSDFRRCLRNVFRLTFPRIPLRLVLSFLKSFLGKRLSDEIHDFRMAVQGMLSERCRTKQNRVKVLQSFQKVLKRIKSAVLRQRQIKFYLKGHQIRKLHIGCGGIILKNWLNADIDPTDKIVFVDAKKRLPFNEHSFDYLFSEHLIEHLTYQEGVHFLRECFRILRPNGKMRIATPDLQFLIGLYHPDKNRLQERYIAWAVDSFLPDVGSYHDTYVINNFFYNWGHRFIYDFKTLYDTMRKAGFIKIKRCKAGESDDSELHGIESHGRVIPEEFNKLETMVVEAMKPDRSN